MIGSTSALTRLHFWLHRSIDEIVISSIVMFFFVREGFFLPITLVEFLSPVKELGRNDHLEENMYISSLEKCFYVVVRCH